MEENLNFGQAIEALKSGKRVARKGWNGKNMFLFLLPAGTVPTKAIHDPALRQVIEEEVGGETFEALGSIRMFTADKKILTGWLASQTDILAEDWVILEKPRFRLFSARGFRLFSARDGKTFVEHLGDAWAWIKGLPAKVRALLPAAEDMVEAVEVLAEAIKEGSPIDQAVDKALAYVPQAHAFYEWAQKWLPIVAERLRALHIEISEGVQYFDGSSPERSLQAAKRDAAAEMVIMYHGGESEVERVLANSAVETAVIIVKHSDLL